MKFAKNQVIFHKLTNNPVQVIDYVEINGTQYVLVCSENMSASEYPFLRPESHFMESPPDTITVKSLEGNSNSHAYFVENATNISVGDMLYSLSLNKVVKVVGINDSSKVVLGYFEGMKLGEKV